LSKINDLAFPQKPQKNSFQSLLACLGTTIFMRYDPSTLLVGGIAVLQGDELTVQLFIAAAGLALLGIAVTQAGWTHKFFVRSLFGVAAILFLCAIFWRNVIEHAPRAFPAHFDT
jgi:hypothetical protein